MLRSFVFFLIILTIYSDSFGQTSSTYGKTLQQMFEASGAEENYDVVISQMLDIFRKQYAEVDREIWDEFESQLTASAMTDLAEMLTPVYSKYLSEQDLLDIIAFYESPSGRKFAKHTPEITQESMKIGERWGAKIAEDLVKKFETEGR